MQKFFRVTLSLTEETNKILNIFSENNEIKKSKLIRYLMLYFNQAPYKLRNILEEAKNDIQRRKDQKIWMDKIHEEIEKQIMEGQKLTKRSQDLWRGFKLKSFYLIRIKRRCYKKRKRIVVFEILFSFLLKFSTKISKVSTLSLLDFGLSIFYFTLKYFCCSE